MQRTRLSRPALVLSLYLAMACAGLVWGVLRGHPNVWRYPAHPQPPQVFAGMLMGVVLGLGIVFLSRLAVHRFEWARALHRDLRARLGPLDETEILVLAGASAIGEEIFFRGAFLPAAGLFLSSAVFSLLHIGPRPMHLPWTLASFVAGLLFAQLFIWSGDLTGPVLAHFTVNFLNLRHLRDIELR
jgi:hypothetical protein